MANPEHLKILDQGVAAWNAWYDDSKKFLGADLRSADLKLRKLNGIDLSGADLRYTKLVGADLSNSKLHIH